MLKFLFFYDAHFCLFFSFVFLFMTKVEERITLKCMQKDKKKLRHCGFYVKDHNKELIETCSSYCHRFVLEVVVFDF